MLLSASAFSRFDPERVAALIRETAEAEILPRFRRLAEGDVHTKADGSIVTEADTTAEAVLTPALKALLPGSEVVGEEAVAADPSILQRMRGGGAVWTVDPVDGTKAFAAGDDTFATMISLCFDGDIVAAWVCVPARDLMAMCVVCEGTTLNGAPVRLNSERIDPTNLQGSYNVRWFVPDMIGRVVNRLAKHPGMKPDKHSGWDLMRMLMGEPCVYLNTHVTPWDTAPPVLLYREAKGIAAPVDGSIYHPANVSGAILYAPGAAAWLRVRDELVPAPRGPVLPLMLEDGTPAERPPRVVVNF